MMKRSSNRRFYIGTNMDTGGLVRLRWDRLATHLHLMGPPGSGKTRLLLWIFQRLAREPQATVILGNPKGDLGRMARDWTIREGMADRLVWFDPRSPIGYNPLWPNGLPESAHAKAVREAIRSAWG